MIATSDGGLHVLFDSWRERELRIATRRSDGSGWDWNTIGEEAFDIDATSDTNGHILVSYVTCTNDGACLLKIARSRD